jgi:pyruvate dehydrogenase phosphatase
MRSFVQVDDRIMDLAKKGSIWEPAMSPIAQAPVQLAMCGSCALLSLYDPANCILRVANVGDSRAVLGRWDAESEKYTCVPLSTDQTGFNPDEVTRIKAAHPGEDDILDPKTGRLLGMAVTRSFGDHRWKWDDDAVRRVQAKFFGPSPRPQSKTPPYMTAEPVVKEVEIVSVNPEEEKRRGTKAKSDFLIMASDGLWDRMSSEDAVLLVQRWLEARERGNGSVLADPQLRRSDWRQPSARILDYDVEEVGYVNWRAEPKYFAIEDDNAAACLLRNALGGSRKELIFSGAVMTSKGRARQVYDDTSIFVVFFDKMEQDGVKKQDEPMTKTRKWLPW